VNIAKLLYPNFNSVKNVVDMIQVSVTSAAADYSTDYDVRNFTLSWEMSHRLYSWETFYNSMPAFNHPIKIMK
jgi:hypothetical protein